MSQTTGPGDPADPTDLPLFRDRARPGAFNLAGRVPTTPVAGPSPGATVLDVQTPQPATPVSTAEVADPLPEPDVDQAPDFAAEAAPDWGWVRQLQTTVTDQMTDRGLTTSTDDRITVESLVEDAVEEFNRRHVAIGEPSLSAVERKKLATATLDTIFGAGRLQALLDRKDLEDIAIRGADNVWLYYADGRVERGDPVAESDEAFITDLQHLAATNPTGERMFNAANPQLDLSLPSGHRLAAAMDYVRRPACTIRFHRHVDVDLADLVRLGSIDETLRQFLAAAIRSGISVVVSGLPGAGKTTLIRALLNELDPTTPIATIETEFELHLDAPEMAHRHVNVLAAQARRGGEDGAGEITLHDLLRQSLRHSVDRIVVGEVRGKEILPMFEAMAAGTGSVSTIHANSAEDTIRRMATCALSAGVTPDFAYGQIADNVDLIVYQHAVDERGIGGRKHRFVSQVIAVEPNADQPNGVGTTPIFMPDHTGRAIPTGALPRWIEQLRLVGYDPAWLTNRQSSWGEIDMLSLRGDRR